MALCCAKYLTGPLLHAQERTSVLLGLTLVWARVIPSIQETSPNYVNCMCHLPHLHSLHIFPINYTPHISLPLVLCSITAHHLYWWLTSLPNVLLKDWQMCTCIIRNAGWYLNTAEKLKSNASGIPSSLHYIMFISYPIPPEHSNHNIKISLSLSHAHFYNRSTNTTMENPCPPLPLHNSSPINCTTSDFSLIMLSMCWVA